MNNYIGKQQIIPMTNIKLKVVDQKNDKLIIELEDGKFFRSDIEHWDKGYTKLNHLSDSYNKFIGEEGLSRDGKKIKIISADKWSMGKEMKIQVQFEDGTVVNSRYKTFKDEKIIYPISKSQNKLSQYFISVSDDIKKQHIGETSTTKFGEEITIIDYINAQNVTVEFNKSKERKKTTYAHFVRGEVKSDFQIQQENKNILQSNRIGERNISNNCGEMEIIEYISTSNIIVKFLDDGSIKKTTYKHFKEGSVESDYLKNKKEQELLERKEQIEQEKKEREEYRLRHIGESITLECGKVALIVDWFTQNNINVEIDNKIYKTTYSSFLTGLLNINKTIERQKMVGTYVENNSRTRAQILSYNLDKNTFILKLDNGYKFEKDCYTVINKTFTTPYDLSYGGIGYLGEKYVPKDYPIIGNMWHSLLDRVVVRKERKQFKAYKDCSVCDRWLCFSNFVDDMLEMWYDCDERLEIDKDIKNKGNKIYSPENCLLVPHRINSLFIGWESGEEHATGVKYVKTGQHKNTWTVKPVGEKVDNGVFRTGVHKHFKNEKDAWKYYKSIKKEYVEKVINNYNGVVPDYILNFCRKRVEDIEFED